MLERIGPQPAHPEAAEPLHDPGQAEPALPAGQRHRPLATYGLLLANALLFGLELLWGGGTVDRALGRMGANHGDWVRGGELWRLLASAFLHASWEHLAANLFALYSFGRFLEWVLGARRFLILYGLSALGGGLASALLRSTPVIAVGASGAIWGLMLAGIGLTLRPRDLVPPRLLQHMRANEWKPLVVNLAISLMPGIDWHAHLGGGAVGLVLLGSGLLTLGLPPGGAAARPADPDAPRTRARGEPLVSAAAALLLLAMAGSVGLALATGRPWELRSAPRQVRVDLPEARLSLQAPASLQLTKLRGVAPSERVESGSGFLGTSVFLIGDPLRDPAAIELIVTALGPPLTQDLPALFQGMKTELQKEPVEGAKIERPVQEQTIDGRACLVFAARFPNELLMEGWATLLPDRVIVLRVYSWPKIAVGWKGLGESVFKSLRDEDG